MALGFNLLLIRITRLLGRGRNRASKSASRLRLQWDTQATWYRLRYKDSERAQEMLFRLSRASGRVALRMRTEDATRCWLGIEPKYDQVVQKMAIAFGCELFQESPPEVWVGTFFQATAVPDDRSADVYIVNGHMFVSQNDPGGVPFPTSPTSVHTETGQWIMPYPALGLTTHATIELPPTRTNFLRHNGSWLFGWDSLGYSVGKHQAGVLGETDYIHRWLTSFILAQWQEHSPEPAIVIDGRGVWLDQFLKIPQVQAAVHSRLVRLIDVRNQQHAFNPLAAALSADPRATAIRWMWWFKGMGVPRDALKKLIPLAIQEQVQTIPQLYQWLQARKAIDPHLVVPLADKIEQLNEEPDVREWLLATERFADPRQWAKQTPLLITPRMADGDNAWARLQGVRALLGLIVEVKAAVVLHDIKRLGHEDKAILKNSKLLVTNSAGEVTVITRCSAPVARGIKQRLSLEISEEYLQLLPPGNAVVAHKLNGATAVSWRSNL